jgi:Mn-dependent DtxR family transcriptional regulator
LSEVEGKNASAAHNKLPAAQPYHPTTFLERGASIPFTAPFLGGTRARPGEKRGLDFIVPNPAGGRGVYIMPWPGIAALGRPTVHDNVLSGRVATLDLVTPATIHRAARQIASEGLAGEAAMEAALTAMGAEKDRRTAANYRLLETLIEQLNLVPVSTASGAAPVLADREQRAKATTAWVAQRLGQSSAWVAEALEDLTDLLKDVTVGSDRTPGRTSRLAADLRQVMAAMSDWGKNQPTDHASATRTICAVGEFTLALAEEMLEKVRSLTSDMLVLLRSWAAAPDTVIRSAGRPEWLLDGWGQICLIWNHARDEAGRRAALGEIAEIVPVLPREVSQWCGNVPDFEGSFQLRGLVRVNEDWRTGATVFDVIARNEHFRSVNC